MLVRVVVETVGDAMKAVNDAIEAVEDAGLAPPHIPGSRYGELSSTPSQLAMTGAARANGKERIRRDAAMALAVVFAAVGAMLTVETKRASLRIDQGKGKREFEQQRGKAIYYGRAFWHHDSISLSPAPSLNLEKRH